MVTPERLHDEACSRRVTPERLHDLAARTRAAWPNQASTAPVRVPLAHIAADRARLASDLAGLLQHSPVGQWCQWCHADDPEGFALYPCPDARRYAEGIERTAALYGCDA